MAVVELKIFEGERERSFVSSRDEIVIGRSGDCDVILQDPHVSGRHAKILYGLAVADLGSLNGTYLDGERIVEPTPLLDRVLRIGGAEDGVRVDVRVESEAAEPGAPGLSVASSATQHVFDAEVYPLLARLRQERVRSQSRQASSGTASELSRADGEASDQAIRFLLTEMLAFVREAEASMQGVAGSFADTPAPAVLQGASDPVELMKHVLRDPADNAAREQFREYVRALRRWLSIWVRAYPAAANRFADAPGPEEAGTDFRARLRRLARDCADEMLKARVSGID